MARGISQGPGRTRSDRRRGRPSGARARFGATVTVEDASGGERRYRIVGVDEADPKRGLVSWRSPVARALVGRSVGDVTTLRTPAGDEELQIVAIDDGDGVADS